MNRIEVIKLQSYDNLKIAKTLPNKKRDLRTVGANLHESLIQCTRNIVHGKLAFSFPKSCSEFECELFCRPVGHFSAQFWAHFGANAPHGKNFQTGHISNNSHLDDLSILVLVVAIGCKV